MTSRADKIKGLITKAITNSMDTSARSIQAAEGIIGPSDVGFCRNKVALMVKGVAPTDSPPKWSAAVGTAIHNYVEAAIKEMYPDWLVGSIDEIETTTILPSGAEIKGHPDVVVPAANAVLDIKTVDGFEWIKREGTSLQHKYQRHLYAMGLVQMGLLSPDNLLVGNVYFDRSGKESEPIVLVEEFDPTLTNEIDSWVQDVIYSVKNGEDASRDIPAAVCERICSHFTACRGALEIHDGAEPITNPELVAAVRMYVEARETASAAEKAKKEAQQRLLGVNGSTGDYNVRWVEVQPTSVQAFEKQGYLRMDIRKAR